MISLRERMMSCRLAVVLFAIVASAGVRAQDPLKTLPNNYSRVYENNDVNVIRAHYGPHEKIPVHDHSNSATVFVYLNSSGQVQINHAEPGEKPEAILRPPTTKGAFRVNNGIAETHSIENLGDTPSDFLRVELKQVTLHLPEPFRGKAPAGLATSQTSLEFQDPAVQVERIVCAGPGSCPVVPSPGGSLLIAILPLHVAVGSSTAQEQMAVGSVRWLPATEAATITPETPVPTEVLRIMLPTSK